ncbi:MAG TPA: lipopolysaccharide heptosyltransferase I [Thermoanaerobaculia bacterium]|nr:lipopolysaccharide heptosyltransferase I [Thermoanaerobaculia bacterium]
MPATSVTAPTPLPDAPRILLVRTSAMGDVVHALPVAAALARHRPGATIGWVVEEAYAPLLTGHPAVDEVLPVRLKRWRRRPFAASTLGELAALRRAFARFRPDVAIDLMGNHKGALLARLSGAPRVVGAARADRREPSSALWIGESADPAATAGSLPVHAVERALALAGTLGASTLPVDLGGAGLFPDLPRVPPANLVLHAGAGWGNKRWPAERWGEVARRLALDTGLPVRAPIGPGEEALVAAVVAASGGVVEPVPAADLPTLASELLGARLVLAGDTGPLHLAHALAVPVLAVMGPTDPRRHGPYGAPARAVWETLPCSFCYKRFTETKACLHAVSVRRVVERALALLASEGGTATYCGPSGPTA